MNVLNRIHHSKKGRLAALFMLIFLDTLPYFLIIPVLLRLIINADTSILPPSVSIHTRDILYGIAIMLSPLAFLIGSPLAGYFSDKYGRRITLVFCLSCAFVGFVLPIFGIYTNSIFLILLGRFIAGGSTSSQPVVQAAITDFTEGKQKAFYLSLIAFAMTLAMVLGPLFGGYLSDPRIVSWFSLKTPYWFGMILSLVNLALLLIFFKDDEQPITHMEKYSFQEKCKILSQALLNNGIIILLLVFLLFEIAWSQYYQAAFLYLTQKFHYSTDHIGLFTTYIGVWMSLGLTVIYKIWLKHHEVERILTISLLIAAVGFVGSNLPYSPILQWIFVIPIAICIGTAYPSLIATLSNRSAPDHQGWVLGSASTIMALSWMLTGFASGALTAVNVDLPFIVATASIIVSLMVLFLSRVLLIKLSKKPASR